MTVHAEAGNDSLYGGSKGLPVPLLGREAGSCSRQTLGSYLQPRLAPTGSMVSRRGVGAGAIRAYWVLSVPLLGRNRCCALALQSDRGPYENHGARPPVVSEWLGVYG